jgi:hypothetical protein
MRRELGTHVRAGASLTPNLRVASWRPDTKSRGGEGVEAVTDLNRGSYCATESRWPLR